MTAAAELPEGAREWLIIAASAPCADAGVERVSRALEQRFAGRLTEDEADFLGDLLGHGVWQVGELTPGRLEKLAAATPGLAAVRVLADLQRERRVREKLLCRLVEAVELALLVGGDLETVRGEVRRLEGLAAEVAA